MDGWKAGGSVWMYLLYLLTPGILLVSMGYGIVWDGVLSYLQMVCGIGGSGGSDSIRSKPYNQSHTIQSHFGSFVHGTLEWNTR
ncbi:hypothetical protein BO71DRAFT_395347 [Aspergillus ellipticus CBS 707.79]|uniref:Uncharacterized protein n=1 Tax=Aspergillus ellipticus CBS 707.79 TaxID=1448320 RepID=A0A319DLF2_9EURO|nr:hypothetical protein BO71DRAFT_395347 [Aspergillus ellipticus CBS 707.79]